MLLCWASTTNTVTRNAKDDPGNSCSRWWLLLLCFTSCWICIHWKVRSSSHQQWRREQEKLSNGFVNLVSNYNRWQSHDDFIFDMLTSLPDSPVYKSMPMSSHCNYISREDVGGNKAPTNTIVFPFNRGNYPQDLGRDGEGGWHCAAVIKLLIF